MRTNYTKYTNLLAAILVLIGSTPSFAQVYATSETNGTTKGCKSCSVINSSLAVDKDLNTFSTLSVSPYDEKESAYQHFVFPKTSMPGSYLQIVVENNNGKELDKDLLDGMSIRTYQDGKYNKDKKDIKDVVLTPMVGSSTKYFIMVLIDDAFNEARFTLNGVKEEGGVAKLNIYYVMYTDPTSLPVTLVSFVAENINSMIELRWSTSTESDNKSFIVERSDDAITFEELATIQGNGTTSGLTPYFYTDKLPATGSNFYRLKSIDNNGGSHYFEIIEVINIAVAGSSVMTIGSNPFQESLNIYYLTNKTGYATIQMIDSDGAEYYLNTIQLEPGSNFYTITNLENVKNGVYSIIIRTEDDVAVQKVVKM